MQKSICFLTLALLLDSNIYAQSPLIDIWVPQPILFNAADQWTPTNIQITAGDTLSIHVEGYASAAYVSMSDSRYWFGPDGWPDQIAPSGLGWPMEGYPMLVVCGKIGESGTPFVVGRNRIFRANVSGSLYLGYNDNNLFDNFGTFVAYVSRGGLIAAPTSIQDGRGNDMGDKFRLSQNYPNPFNPTTTIAYQLPRRGSLEISVYNSIGQLVKTLVDGKIEEAGNYVITWDGKNEIGNTVPTGTYFYQVRLDNQVQAKKMLLIK